MNEIPANEPREPGSGRERARSPPLNGRFSFSPTKRPSREGRFLWQIQDSLRKKGRYAMFSLAFFLLGVPGPTKSQDVKVREILAELQYIFVTDIPIWHANTDDGC